jgi:hypothetical protein
MFTIHYDVAPSVLGIHHVSMEWDREDQVPIRYPGCATFLQYQNDWEVRFWLGEQGVAGVNTSLEKDKRIRCPSCVLMGNPLRLQESGMKIVWPEGHPELSEVLKDTLERRAKMQGY